MPDETAELHNYIPAGSTCCCEQTSWLGKRPTAAPLTDTFIRTAVKGGAIVPPHDGPDPLLWRGVRNGLLITGVCAFVIWAVVHFTRV